MDEQEEIVALLKRQPKTKTQFNLWLKQTVKTGGKLDHTHLRGNWIQRGIDSFALNLWGRVLAIADDNDVSEVCWVLDKSVRSRGKESRWPIALLHYLFPLPFACAYLILNVALFCTLLVAPEMLFAPPVTQALLVDFIISLLYYRGHRLMRNNLGASLAKKGG